MSAVSNEDILKELRRWHADNLLTTAKLMALLAQLAARVEALERQA